MEGAEGVVSLPTWMQLAATFIVLLFAAGSGIFSYLHSAKTSGNKDAETIALLRRLASSNEAIEGSRTPATSAEMIELLERVAISSEKLLELAQNQRADVMFRDRVKDEVQRQRLEDRRQRLVDARQRKLEKNDAPVNKP
jgi:hypothetical protein